MSTATIGGNALQRCLRPFNALEDVLQIQCVLSGACQWHSISRRRPQYAKPWAHRNFSAQPRSGFHLAAAPAKPITHQASLTGRTPKSTASKYDGRTTKQIYEALNVEASKGNIDNVWDMVLHLVRDRHEEPSIRLYDALILGNLNPAHGSADDMISLVREMVKDGINPDSKVYHSMLKVCPRPTSIWFAQWMLMRSRCLRYIQIISSETRYSMKCNNGGSS